MSNKRIVSIADLKGLRLRVLGAANASLLGALGAVAVANMSGNEVYDALDKGVIDGVLTSVSAVSSGKWWEATKYAWIPPYSAATGWGFAMNKDLYESLTPETQDIFIQVWEEANNEFIRRAMDENAAMLQSWKDDFGMEFSDFDPADQPALDAAVEAARQSWYTEYDAGKGLETEEFFGAFVAEQSKYEQEVKDKGYPWER